MFCRRFSSCILLIIIVLSFSRTPIIANAAKASAQENDTTPTDVSVNALQAENYKAFLNELIEKFGKSNKFIAHSFIALQMIWQDSDRNRAVEIMDILKPLVKYINQSEHAASVMISLSQIANSESLLPDQDVEILSMLETLVKYINQSEHAASVMISLSQIANSKSLLPNQVDEILSMLEKLVENVDQSEHAASVMIKLSQIVKSESLSLNQVVKKISMSEKLVKLVDTSQDAVLVMKQYSNLIGKIYSSLKFLKLDLVDDITRDKVKEEGHRLFGIMSELCKKVVNFQDVSSSIETLFMVLNEFQRVYIVLFKRTHSIYNDVIFDSWKDMTQNLWNQILRGMQCLSERIDDAKYAESMMTNLMDNFYWDTMPTNQLEILIDIMKHLININGFNKAQFTHPISEFLAMQKCLTSEQIDRILSMLKDSITEVNEPKQKISVIDVLFWMIEIRNSRQGLDETQFSSSQINLILRMLKDLIESVDDINTALEIKSNFMRIESFRSALRGDGDKEQLLDAIIRYLDQRCSDINA